MTPTPLYTEVTTSAKSTSEQLPHTFLNTEASVAVGSVLGEEASTSSTTETSALNETSNEVKNNSMAEVSVQKKNEEQTLNDDQELSHEILICDPLAVKLDGRRLIYISFVLQQIKNMDNDETLFERGFKDMIVVNERRHGLKSFITMQCQMCKTEMNLCTDPPGKNNMDINTSAVSGTMSTRGGHAQLEETLSTMNIPCMSYKTFTKYHDFVADGWKQTAQEEMSIAAKEAAEEAIKRGHVDVDGVPILTVVVDGAWTKSPGKFSKTCQIKRKRKVRLNRERRNKRPKAKHSLFTEKYQYQATDKNYGPNAQTPDLSENELKEHKYEFLVRLCLSKEQRDQLERNTRQQNESPKELEEKRKRMTASNFGKICKRRPTTSCKILVRDLLYGTMKSTQAMLYGPFHEELALKAAEQTIGRELNKCGMFVDNEYTYIAATPGLTSDGKGLVEIKFPLKIANIHPKQAAKDGMLEYLKVTDDRIEINRRHSYHYQIQGQLRVTGKEYCLFGVWSSKGIEVLEIHRDEDFWKKDIEPYLIRFYVD
ncbi:hypothetical protein PR048_008767 [Dryococelus australis]|uniref:YqaJ viral recombinase domain-containing protein n=1 Tax=Dryococelus australis TaxID=614101 RepID=A0ABQ9HYW9_9NEOP|nr:hypothetical protein PR048_008767 [Dryococelus australis]